jgi:ABC-type sugar transport system permease subunit
MDALQNLGPIMTFVYLGLPPLSLPIGFVIALIVRRMMPVFNLMLIAIMAGYSVIATIIFVIVQRLFFQDISGIAAAAAISLILAMVVILVIAYSIKRILFADEKRLKEEQSFSVFGEDAREKPKNLRRR